MNEDLQTVLVIVSIFVFGFLYLKLRVDWVRKEHRRLKKREYKRKGNYVIARVKKKENGVWLCKFFCNGDHLGYLLRKPSRDRIPALVIDEDKARKCFVLEEIEEEES